ncbi:MAG: hypothetical protein H2069_04710 [Legionella sp.]|nr:hypothetical protein [Legionella sp.]
MKKAETLNEHTSNLENDTEYCKPNIVAEYIVTKYSDQFGDDLPVEYKEDWTRQRVYRLNKITKEDKEKIRNLLNAELIEFFQQGKHIEAHQELVQVVLGKCGRSTHYKNLNSLNTNYEKALSGLSEEEKAKNLSCPNLLVKYILKKYFIDQNTYNKKYVKNFYNNHLHSGFYTYTINHEDKINAESLLAEIKKKVEFEYKEIKKALEDEKAQALEEMISLECASTVEKNPESSLKSNSAHRRIRPAYVAPLDIITEYAKNVGCCKWTLAADLQDCRTNLERRPPVRDRFYTTLPMNKNKRSAAYPLEDIGAQTVSSAKREEFLTESLRLQTNPQDLTNLKDTNLSAFSNPDPLSQYSQGQDHDVQQKLNTPTFDAESSKQNFLVSPIEREKNSAVNITVNKRDCSTQTHFPSNYADCSTQTNFPNNDAEGCKVEKIRYRRGGHILKNRIALAKRTSVKHMPLKGESVNIVFSNDSLYIDNKKDNEQPIQSTDVKKISPKKSSLTLIFSKNAYNIKGSNQSQHYPPSMH